VKLGIVIGSIAVGVVAVAATIGMLFFLVIRLRKPISPMSTSFEDVDYEHLDEEDGVEEEQEKVQQERRVRVET
jgi:hypothetical protein